MGLFETTHRLEYKQQGYTDYINKTPELNNNERHNVQKLEGHSSTSEGVREVKEVHIQQL